MLLGGATVLWPYGTSFYAEAWPAAAFVWAAALLLSARTRAVDDPGRARILIAAASLLLTVAGLAKATSLVFAPAFIVAALSDRAAPLPARVRTALALATGIGIAGAAHLTLNAYRFGNPLDFGYGWAEMVPQLPPRLFLGRDVPRGLVVLLLSPGKSVLLWAAAAPARARARPHVLVTRARADPGRCLRGDLRADLLCRLSLS